MTVKLTDESNWFIENFDQIGIVIDVCEAFFDFIDVKLGLNALKEGTSFLNEAERIKYEEWDRKADVDCEDPECVTGCENFDVYLEGLSRHFGPAVIARQLQEFMRVYRLENPVVQQLETSKLAEYNMHTLYSLLKATETRRPALQMVVNNSANGGPA